MKHTPVQSFKKLSAISLTLILLFGSINVFAQFSGDSQNKSSGSALTQNTTVVAGQSITLLPGFQTNGFSFTASINTSISGCVPLAASLSSNINYVLTYSPRVPITDAGQLINKTICEVNQTVQYIDGLGRPVQTVQTKASPTAQDIIVPIEYDAFGREVKKYLPYANNLNTGSYRSTALTDVVSYYAAAPQGQFSAFSSPYAQTVLEASPLNRVQEQGSPGDAWQPGTRTSTGGRTVLTEYSSNTAQGGEYAARRYSAVAAADTYLRSLQDNGYYSANELYVTITKDENWTSGRAGRIEEYKDKEGHVVLKRIWKDESVSLSTYYIYDDMGNLSYVLSPKAEGDNGSISQAVLNDLCYQYRYDERKRLVEKKIPGKGWEYIVYNNIDQAVLSQDALQRANNHWSFTKYDALGRVVITGIYSRSIDRSGLQTEVSNHPNLAWEAFENNGTTNYSNRSFPQSVAYYQQINYYDTYDIPGKNTDFNASQAISSQINGLLTGSRTYLIDGSNSYLSVTYYDDYGKAIENVSANHIGGTDRVVNTYNDITAEVLSSTRTHTSSYDQITISNDYGYDHMGRRKYVKQNINNNSRIVIAGYDYTETGQLLAKNLGDNNTSDYINSTFSRGNFMQNVDYKYNERGWLKRSSAGLFDMVLNYQDSNNPQFNGNISAQNWGTLNNRTKNYTYSYDALNRLTAGSSDQGYSESIGSYDKNGNIESLSRTGRENGTQSYTYDGNRLTQLSGMRTGTFLYTDNNGNLNSDGARGINISYNYLNLPQNISGNKAITYTYDATGRKLKKVSNISGTTDYVNGIHYKNISGTYQIEFVQTEEGRALKNGSNNQGTASYGYQFTLADQLGNNRITFYRNPATQNVEQLEATDYYAFGMSTTDPSGKENKYLYNKKENQEELEEYDYGARFYDPVIARWNVVDPLAEKYSSLSPYNYVANNPLKYIDPDGRDIILAQSVRKDGTKVMNITVTGKLINQSSSKYTAAQMQKYASRISSAIKSYYSSASEKGFEVNVTANISVASDKNPLSKKDHAFRIVDDGKLPDSQKPGSFRPSGVIGHAAFGEKGVYINNEIVNDNKPAATGPYAGTGKTSQGEATLERTSAHELGHTGTLPHPETGSMPGNLMNQTGQPDAGTEITKEQIIKMKEAYDKGQLNRGRQSY